MSYIKPRILSGFMELMPEDQILFNEMLDKIKRTYESYGFLPLDTPVIETSEVLLAKAGGETEKQIYRFNKGDNDLSLRFDLTVPLARFVAMHYGELVFPFKRYQIGKVYRGERPQRGRFREFYQCDIDIIGNETLDIKNDAIIPSIINDLFKSLNLGDFYIRCNNRKIMNGFLYTVDTDVEPSYIMRIIDKIDKIGKDEVISLLKELNIKDNEINRIMDFILLNGSNEQKINKLKSMNINNSIFMDGINEMESVIKYVKSFGVKDDNFVFDLTITRGLDYYTGTVYETFLKDHMDLGSVCSGGRYENLASFYTDQKLPGVGISIGLTRLFWQLKESGIIKANTSSTAKYFVIPMDDNTLDYASVIANKIRSKGINVELSTTGANFKSNLKYANRLSIPYVIIIGEDEVSNKSITIKDMNSGTQDNIPLDKLEERIEING